MICVPITATTIEEASKEIAQANKVADAIELRADYIRGINTHTLEKLIKECKKKCIVTIRPKKYRGKFSGNEKARIALLKKAVLGGADFIDVEFGTKPATIKSLNAKGHTKIILSYHNFRSTPNIAELKELYAKMKEVKGVSILKIVTYAKSINDNATIFSLLKHARNDRQEIIAFAMGLLGRDSRILSLPMGAYLTFASLRQGKESAEGQIPFEELKKVYQGLKFMFGGF